VVARRVVVRKLVGSRGATPLSAAAEAAEAPAPNNGAEQRITDREEVAHLMEQLDDSEAAVVRMYHLEGKSYQEISSSTGMPTNSVGPLLTRARTKLRNASAH